LRPGLRPFKKGQSGNPGGRPKGYREFAERARACRRGCRRTRAQFRACERRTACSNRPGINAHIPLGMAPHPRRDGFRIRAQNAAGADACPRPSPDDVPASGSPMIIAETETHIVVAMEIAKATLARHRRFLELLLARPSVRTCRGGDKLESRRLGRRAEHAELCTAPPPRPLAERAKQRGARGQQEDATRHHGGRCVARAR
jgi:hypothetical protein